MRGRAVSRQVPRNPARGGRSRSRSPPDAGTSRVNGQAWGPWLITTGQIAVRGRFCYAAEWADGEQRWAEALSSWVAVVVTGADVLSSRLGPWARHPRLGAG